ncbi:MAG TPA: LytR C-terminal domain-containing protein [Pilimelia sp.]|nr:LytR C-terminal domain-containing protein [Pilimelia sp.]
MSFARVRALVFVGTLAVVALVFVVVAIVRDSQRTAPGAQGCPEGWVVVDLRLPEPKEVKINIFNATSNSGLAQQVAEDFRNRQFQVKKVSNSKKAVQEVAVLRYGPKAYGAGHLLRSYFLDEAVEQYDKNRKDDTVDVIIGTGFQQLGTTTEVNQSVAALGKPALPAGSCAAQ